MLKSEKKIVDQIFKKVVQCLHLFKSFKHFFYDKKRKTIIETILYCCFFEGQILV